MISNDSLQTAELRKACRSSEELEYSELWLVVYQRKAWEKELLLRINRQDESLFLSIRNFGRVQLREQLVKEKSIELAKPSQ